MFTWLPLPSAISPLPPCPFLLFPHLLHEPKCSYNSWSVELHIISELVQQAICWDDLEMTLSLGLSLGAGLTLFPQTAVGR